jgi:hypothetical protein
MDLAGSADPGLNHFNCTLVADAPEVVAVEACLDFPALRLAYCRRSREIQE